MSRVQDILTRARDTINDHAATRWSNDNLLRLLNEGQRDLAMHTRLLKGTAVVPLEAGKHTYSLPEDLLVLLRVTYDNVVLPLKLHSELDKSLYSNIKANTAATNKDWVTKTTELSLELAVFDKLNSQKLRVYPIPVGLVTEDFTATSTVGIVNTITEDGTTFVPSTNFGIINTIVDDDSQTTVNSDYGITTSIANVKSLFIYYVKSPRVVNALDSVLEVDSNWDTALKHYVTGKALLEDGREQNRAMGKDELRFYDRLLGLAEEVSSSNAVASDTYQTYYNGMG